MIITATTLKGNIGHYLDLAVKEDIFVTRKGKVVAKISNPIESKQDILDGLVGIASTVDVSLDDARAQRLARQ